MLDKLLQRWKTDEALMQAYQKGNVAAFELLYQRHKEALFSFLYRSCQQPAVIEDIAHDAWLAVIDKAPQYQASAQFRTWLYRIANNKLIDHWRRNEVRQKHVEQHSGDSEFDTSNTEYSTAELNLLVQQALSQIEQLPMAQKQAFLLRESGFSLQEIADIQDTEIESVKSRLRYAVAKLRRILDPKTRAEGGNNNAK